MRQAAAETSLPAFVIGGVTLQNLEAALAASGPPRRGRARNLPVRNTSRDCSSNSPPARLNGFNVELLYYRHL